MLIPPLPDQGEGAGGYATARIPGCRRGLLRRREEWGTRGFGGGPKRYEDTIPRVWLAGPVCEVMGEDFTRAQLATYARVIPDMDQPLHV